MTAEARGASIRRALVTGITGLVGSHVARAFLAHDVEVIGACRRAPRAEQRISGVRYEVVGNLDRETRWDDVLSGVDVVVHAAAHAHVMSPTAADHSAYRSVNVGGTQNLAAAVRRVGVGRLVFVSSIKVNGEATPRGAFGATDKPAPRDAFGRCKADGEQVVRDELSASNWTIVRPPLVYGPGMRGNFARMAHLVSTGLPLPFAAVRNRRSLIGVENLADLIRVMCSHPAASGKVWLASDDNDVSTPEIIRAIATEIGLPARLWPCPTWLLRTAGAVIGRGAEMRRLTESLYLDIEPTRQLLGWAPSVSFRDGLARALEGYRVSA